MSHWVATDTTFTVPWTSPRATGNAIIDAQDTAFRATRLLMRTDDGEGLCHALRLPGSATHIGPTRDNVGSTNWACRR